MKVQFLTFEQTQSAVDADWARKFYEEAAYERLSYECAHLFERRTLFQEAKYQAKVRELLKKEYELYTEWRRLEEQFCAELQVLFSEPPEEDLMTFLSHYWNI
jgi:hypothetical protein